MEYQQCILAIRPVEVIERDESIPVEIKLGFRLANIDDPEENIED